MGILLARSATGWCAWQPGDGDGRAGLAATLATGCRTGATPDVRRPAPARTGALARPLAADPGVDAGAHRPGAGPRCAHHRELARGVPATRPGRLAERRAWRPPALTTAEQ